MERVRSVVNRARLSKEKKYRVKESLCVGTLDLVCGNSKSCVWEL